ncbi:MAG: lipoyl(octanoyl) transferase LipB [Planctomycetota bacterium]|nr:lipoyl(octanoyl) transferase LipB [Planctomycetota bacterium]
MTIAIENWGLIDYEEALAKQRARLKQRAKGEVEDALVLCEHPEVVTVGRALKESAMAVAGASMAKIPVVNVARGGQATLHLPGQIVGYPILKLEGKKKDARGVLRMIEGVLIDALGDLADIKARRKDRWTGVWVDERKIASIGIGIEGWVSYHGFALNVNNDLSRFQLISPCGLSPDIMTSVERESSKDVATDFEAAFPDWIGPAFTKAFAALGSQSS